MNNIFNQAMNSSSLRANLITDGHFSCSYQDISKVFEGIEKLFSARSIGIEDYLTLECDNSVPSALTLLYLLEKGYSFLLLPKAVQTPQALDSKQLVPRFCRYRIIPEGLTAEGKAVSLEHPEQFLSVVKNEEWIGKYEGVKNASQKLFMRTSGSTGMPKLAVYSHSKLMGNVLNCVHRLGLTSEDTIAIPVPIFHMYGLGAAFLPSVAVGASIDLQKGANLLRYLQREKEFNPNVAFITPIFCETLLKGRKSARAYRLTVTAGDRLREDTFATYESRFGCLLKLYGSTEMGAIAAASPDEPSEVRAQTIGLPMSGVQMRVEPAQVESTEEMKGVGELWCSHKYGFDGYVDADGQPINQSHNSQENWFYTKDLGRISPDGRVEILGRCDYSVNRDGLLVLFSDVENAIETIDGIESVVVISWGENKRGKGLIAYCVLEKGVNMSEVDIRESCFKIMPRRAIPDNIFIVNSLPLLPSGKVDRQKLISGLQSSQ